MGVPDKGLAVPHPLDPLLPHLLKEAEGALGDKLRLQAVARFLRSSDFPQKRTDLRSETDRGFLRGGGGEAEERGSERGSGTSLGRDGRDESSRGS